MQEPGSRRGAGEVEGEEVDICTVYLNMRLLNREYYTAMLVFHEDFHWDTEQMHAHKSVALFFVARVFAVHKRRGPQQQGEEWPQEEADSSGPFSVLPDWRVSPPRIQATLRYTIGELLACRALRPCLDS